MAFLCEHESECATCEATCGECDDNVSMYVCSAQTCASRHWESETKPTMSEECVSVFDTLKRLGVAGRPLEKNEERVVARLAEAAKQLLDDNARELIIRAQKRAVLYAYQGDGTPLKLRHAIQVAFAEHSKHARSGYTGAELYCQGAFVRTFDARGNAVVTSLMRDPRPMAGKSALHAFNALVEFFPTLDQLEHEGFHIHHYSWDRALFSACRTLARRYHTTILRKLVDRTAQHKGTLHVLRSWLLCTGCGLHDIHNGFSWGISKFLQSKDMLDELFIVLESLRNGYKHLQQHLASFLVEKVVFEDLEGVNTYDLQAFWAALDVPPDLCAMLSERGVWWQNGNLYVKKAYKDDTDILEWLYNACLTVYRFKKFSSSRWISIGSCLRTLIASCALGIRELHKMTIEAPGVGSYYLGGFSRLNGALRHVSVVAALSSRPTESLALTVLEDDRAVRNIQDYEDTLQDEMEWLQTIGELVWDLLALASDSGSSGRSIRADCLDCAHTSCGYTTTHFFEQVRTLPWSLAIGDISSNLDRFALSTEAVHDPVARKIKQLLDMQYNRAELEEAVSMLKECRWSTAFAEQLHAHAAVLHKLHREYGPDTICGRSMVQFLKLLCEVDPEEKEEAKARKKLTLLSKKQPEKASGRSHFLGAFAQEATTAARAHDKPLTEEQTQEIWAAGGRRWESLSLQQKRAFDSSASASTREKRRCLEADKRKVRSDLVLSQRRAAETRLEQGVQNRVSSCRLTGPQRERLQHLFSTLTNIPARRRLAMAELEKPVKRLVDDLMSVQIPEPTASRPGPQEWVKRLCKHRDLFAQKVLCVCGDSLKHYYYFLYATQSPQDVILAPLELERTLAADQVGPCRALNMPVAEQCASFTLSVGTYLSCRTLALPDDEYVHVIPYPAAFGSGSTVACDSRDLVYYQDFLKGQPEPVTEKKDSQQGGRSKKQDELLKTNPWMAKAMDKKKPHTRPPDEDSDESGEEDDPKVTEDFVEQVMATLRAKRTEFGDVHTHEASDFSVYLRKEYSQRGTASTVPDSARAEAHSCAHLFCKTHHLKMSSTFAFQDCGGDSGAHKLAQEWCRKMQHFYNAEMTLSSPVNWAAVAASYPRNEEYERWVSEHRQEKVRERAAQIASLMPL